MADPTKGDAGFNAAGVRRFDAGRPISAGQLNRMAAHSTAAQSRASGGGLYSSGPYGTILHPGTRSRRTSEPPPFKVLDASDANGPKVRVLPGTVYVSVAPTVGGVSILAEPPPTISTEQSGFLVMRSTWPDDFVPRCVPLSVVIEFEPGDPSASYSPPNADTRASARMAFGRVWVADGKITKLFSELSRNVVMERQIYDNGDTSVKHIAFGR